MHLDLDGSGTLHAQLTRALKQAVLDRGLGAGTRLPATRELAASLGLSRNTVVSAYEQLAAEGYIEGHVGSGYYVVALPVPGAWPPSSAPIARPAGAGCACATTSSTGCRW